MNSFHEYYQIRLLASEMNIPYQEAVRLINEGFLADLAKKYALPVAVVMAIMNGQGCNSQQCPTPQVQQQIKQEVQAKSVTSPEASQFLAQTQAQPTAPQAQTKQVEGVTIEGNNFTATAQVRIGKAFGGTLTDKQVAQDRAVMLAKKKVAQAVGSTSLQFYRTTTEASNANGVLTVTLRGSLTPPNDGMQPQANVTPNNNDSASPNRLP